MATKRAHAVRFWVVKATPVSGTDYDLDVVPLEDEAALYGPVDAIYRKFSGVLLLISDQSRRTFRATIGAGHVQRRGHIWHCRGAALPEDGSFLLTDELSVSTIFRGDVRIAGNRRLEELLESEGAHATIPLVGDTWYGALSLQETSPHAKGFLTAFSEEEGKVLQGEVMAKWIETDEDIRLILI